MEARFKEAAENAAVDMVRAMLAEGYDIHRPISDFLHYIDALHAATFWHQTEIVKLLLDAGANVNSRDRYGRTALHDAARSSDVDIVKALLEHDADVNLADNEGILPLQITNNGVIARLLIEKGATIGGPLLYDAVSACNYEVAKVLVEMGADLKWQTNLGYTALHAAIWNESVEMIKCLIDHGAELHVQDHSPYMLIHALNVIKQLLKSKPTHGSITLSNMMEMIAALLTDPSEAGPSEADPSEADEDS